jgi:pimeloyl-ACP methyl ester carboxylesterase
MYWPSLKASCGLLKTIQYQSSRIAYHEEGKGDTIILLHGFAEDHFIWNQLVPDLKNDFRLILPDLPGSGLSERIEDMSMEGMAGCILRILDIECQGPRRPFLIGHSMGGYIALALVEKYPGKLAGLGLFHSTAFPDTEEKKSIRVKSMEFIRRNGSGPFICQSIPNLFSERFKSQYPKLVEGLTERYANFLPASLLSYYESMLKRPDRRAVLKSFPGRVLFVIGEEDPAVPLADSLKQCHLPNWSHIHIFENTAHMGMLENPARSIRAFKDFAKE